MEFFLGQGYLAVYTARYMAIQQQFIIFCYRQIFYLDTKLYAIHQLCYNYSNNAYICRVFQITGLISLCSHICLKNVYRYPVKIFCLEYFEDDEKSYSKTTTNYQYKIIPITLNKNSYKILQVSQQQVQTLKTLVNTNKITQFKN